MKLTCGIVMDLLPLYEEGICSEETKQAVEEHLEECENCRKMYERTQNIPLVRFESSNTSQEKAIKKGFKKIKINWGLSLIIAIILIPLCILGWNQYKGSGMSFTNMKELRMANSFMKQLQQGEYEKAFEYIDLEYTERSMVQLGKNKLEKIKERAPEIFVKSADKLKDAGGIKDVQYVGITKQESGNGITYEVAYKIKIGEEKHDFEIEVWDDGIMNVRSDGSLTDTLGYFCAWSEWLWEDLAGCSFFWY